MKEHIDEMTKVLVDYTKKNHIMASHVILEDYAEHLYNAGYRKQEWISVDDRLPPKNEMVLIFCGGARELDWICSTGLWYDHDYTLVTHWMPLPEPPKMKGD